MKKIDLFVSLIFIVKFIFIFLSLFHLFDKMQGKINTPRDNAILFWRKRVEFIFITMMAILLIYVFNPMNKSELIIDKEIKLLFFLFGVILIIKAEWKLFFTETNVLKKVQYAL